MRKMIRQWMIDQSGVDDTETFLLITGVFLGMSLAYYAISLIWPTGLQTLFTWTSGVRANPSTILSIPMAVVIISIVIALSAVGGGVMGLFLAASGIGIVDTYDQSGENVKR